MDVISMPVIDTHIHLFDPARLQGIPWPPKDDAVLYKSALPQRYREVTHGLGIAGAIELECSPRLEDNQWVLDVAAAEPLIVGMIGDLEPGKPGFREQLDRFHRNPLFLGIRCGNLWGRDLGADVLRPDFISDLRALAGGGLTLDTANPDPALLGAVVRLSDQIPGLRIVIDHLPQLAADAWKLKIVRDDLCELGQRPQVYAKISEVLRATDGAVGRDVNLYRVMLDEIWEIFGDDRLVYGSDWPNCDHISTLPEGLAVVREYVASRGAAAAEKLFWKNSLAAYRWIKRDASQPQLAG